MFTKNYNPYLFSLYDAILVAMAITLVQGMYLVIMGVITLLVGLYSANGHINRILDHICTSKGFWYFTGVALIVVGLILILLAILMVDGDISMATIWLFKEILSILILVTFVVAMAINGRPVGLFALLWLPFSIYLWFTILYYVFTMARENKIRYNDPDYV